MPSQSPEQHRLMEAAAHTPGGYDGVTQAVGKEFVAADSEPTAAGILYRDSDGLILLGKRQGADYADHWAFPGGKIEADDESTTKAAEREFAEETGQEVTAAGALGQFGNFAAYHATGPRFEPKIDAEHSEFGWFHPDALPVPMHPNAALAIASDAFIRIGMNELDIARAMSECRLTSPQIYGNVALFDIRITGTGVAYRSANEEFTWRNPADYLNPEFLARCNGLTVIFEHPKKGVLDSEEFKDRTIGSILYPYIKGDEVWGIAKIYDAGAIELLSTEVLSTSPSVVTKGDAKLVLSDGSEVTVEGKPCLLDHIAICEMGVWDKGGPAAGVNSNQAGAAIMPTEAEMKAKADAEAAEKKELMAKLDAAMAKIDALEKKVDEMPTEMMADAKKDADEKASKEKEEKEKEEKEEKEKADAEEAEKKVREEEKAKADSIRSELDALKASMPRAMSDDDMNALSDAQAKADSVFAAFGEAAPKPMQGEAPLSYRRRLAGRLKAHSVTYKDADLAKADGVFFDTAEAAIYADAERAAFSATDAKPGQLRPHTVRSKTGHVITTFHGDPAAYRCSFDAPAKTVDSFRTRSTH